MNNISMIVATSKATNLIGSNNKLPWHVPEDLRFFKEMTLGKHIVMGKNTFLGINKVLPNRTTIVLSKDVNFSYPGVIVYNDVNKLIKDYSDTDLIIAGGSSIYELFYKMANKLYITLIAPADGSMEFCGDSYFVDYKKNFKCTFESETKKSKLNGTYYTFTTWEKV